MTMRCDPNPDMFTIITIHTAKCTICNERNKGTMRRCQQCSWQICGNCFNRKNGGPLLHGPTINPKMIAAQEAWKNGTWAQSAGATTSTAAQAPGSAIASTQGPASPAPGNATATPGNVPVVAPPHATTAPAPAPVVALPPSASKPTPKAKGKRPANPITIDDDDDGEDTFERSPTPTNRGKRAKTAEPATTTGTETPESEYADAYVPRPTMTGRFVPANRYTPAPGEGSDSDIEMLETGPAKTKAKGKAPARPIPSKPITSLTMEEWDQRRDRDYYTPGQSLLDRREPQIVVPPPPVVPEMIKRIARGENKPTAAEIQHNIQTKLREKLGMMEGRRDSTSTLRGSFSTVAGSQTTLTAPGTPTMLGDTMEPLNLESDEELTVQDAIVQIIREDLFFPSALSADEIDQLQQGMTDKALVELSTIGSRLPRAVRELVRARIPRIPMADIPQAYQAALQRRLSAHGQRLVEGILKQREIFARATEQEQTYQQVRSATQGYVNPQDPRRDTPLGSDPVDPSSIVPQPAPSNRTI